MTQGVEYRYIRAWGQHLGSLPSYVENQIALAKADGAPQDVFSSTHRDSSGYSSLDRNDRAANFAAGDRIWQRWSPDRWTTDSRDTLERILERIGAPVDGYDVAQYVTETAMFGSGFSGYSWWHSIEQVGWKYDRLTDTAPDGWIWRVTGGEDDEQTTALVTHEKIMTAARRVLDGGGGKNLGEKCRRECAKLVYFGGEADFDASLADTLMQVVVFGEVTYG